MDPTIDDGGIAAAIMTTEERALIVAGAGLVGFLLGDFKGLLVGIVGGAIFNHVAKPQASNAAIARLQSQAYR